MNPQRKRLISEASALLEQASEAAIRCDQAAFDQLVEEAGARIALAGPRAILDMPTECPHKVVH